MTRFSVLRLCHASKLVIKEPNRPTTLVAIPADPLHDAQLRRLVLAAPWAPIFIEATLEEGWDPKAGAFRVQIESIELPPRRPEPPRPKRRCDANKQHSRMLSLI